MKKLQAALLIFLAAILLEASAAGIECKYNFEVNTNRQVRGGEEISGIKSLVGCNDMCSSDMDCYGFDWRDTDQKCYRIATNLPMSYKFGITHYTPITVQCGECGFAFEERKGLSVQGGVPKFSLRSVDECKEQCKNDVLCIGCDWRYEDSKCWFTINADATTVMRPGISHFEKKLKCGACTYAYYPGQTAAMSNPIEVIDKIPLADCIDICCGNPSCKAVLYDKQNLKCEQYSVIGQRSYSEKYNYYEQI